MLHFLLFLFGISLGSFLNAWMFRTHNNGSIWHGRSYCIHCNHALAWRDTIPIISFLILKGRCRFCSARIDIQYPIVELWMGIAFVFLGWWHGFDVLVMIRDGFIIFFLTFVFVSDLRFMEIPMCATLAPAGTLFLFSSILEPKKMFPMFLGAGILAGFFFLQYALSRGKWIGLGDVWLGVFLGVVLGYAGILYVLVGLFTSYLFGACIAVVLLIFWKKSRKTKVPFGSILAIGTAIVLFMGEPILSWYGGLL